MTKFQVTIRMKKPYTAIYPCKPSKDLAIEGFADSLLAEDIDDLLEVKITKIEE